ncbi:hypothetical protein PV328_011585 [Microctonus aethiopoides]|uniref:WD repeat-containing protein 65 n=1 Tax=Microctonus aethiopoides TaxID=144406 RepID=A0AA39C4U7_9HYME|nr:hypothetical protein PV328_011585 [Microctonus aethiopoides]
MSVATLETKVLYGLKTNVIGNAHFITDNDILYPVGNALAIHNFAQRRQRLLPLPDKNNINIIAISPNKKYVALCEINEKPTISVYDTHSLKRKKTLGIPYEAPGVTGFSCISFSYDSCYIAAVTGEPDQTMIYYLWEKGKVESSIKLINQQNHAAIINLIACNPNDVGIISIAGDYYFKLLTVSETIWRPYGFSKAENLLISSIVWLTTDRLLAGTRDGRILIIENGDLKSIYNISEITMINFKIREDFIIQPTVIASKSIEKNNIEDNEFSVNDIRCLISFPKGFAFGFGLKTLMVFERDGQHKYLKKHIFIVPTQVSCELISDHYKINSISINLSYDSLLVTTGWSQLFYAKIFDIDSLLEPEPLKILGYSLHNGPIGGISMCTWKSIFMTYGITDQSVRIWDYENESLIMIKQYNEEIFSISLHPIGLFCLIGFSDKLRFLTILIDDLLPTEEFSIRNCRSAEFSHGGHLFGAVNGNIIQIYRTIGFNNCFLLKGHTSKIEKMIWSQNDMKLITVGSESTIYVWDMSNGSRIGEIILKHVLLKSVAVTADGEIIYCIADDNKIREIRDSVILREFNIDNVTMNLLLMGNSDCLAFISSPNGAIMSFKYPFQEPLESKHFHIHSTNINCMTISFHEQIVVTSDEDGNLCLWRVIITEKNLNLRDITYTNEILISKNDLEDKIRLIQELNLRISELETEQEYKIRQIEVMHNEKMRLVHQGYCDAIEELKIRIDKLQEDRTNELNNINVEIVKLKASHEKSMQELMMNYDAKLINEYDKFMAFEKSSYTMKKNNETKLEEINMNNQRELERIIKKFTDQIHEKNIKFEELEEEMSYQMRLHDEIKTQIEDDADREIIEMRSNYENQLHEERQINLKLRGEAGVLSNRYTASQKTIDDIKRQIVQLKNECKQYQKIIQQFENNVLDLKNEVSERDTTIQEKEKYINNIQRNNQDLEKHKFVLNYKIRELKNQIEPRDSEIKDLKKKIQYIEMELVNLHKMNGILELQLNETREKKSAIKRELHLEIKKNQNDDIIMKKVQAGLADAITVIHDPVALKSIVKHLYQNYSTNKEFSQHRRADLEAQCEFARQRDQLERTVESLKKHIHRKTSSNRKSDTNNLQLLNENIEKPMTMQDIYLVKDLLIRADKYIKEIKMNNGGEKFNEIFETFNEFKMPFEECQRIIIALHNEIMTLMKKPENITLKD